MRDLENTGKGNEGSNNVGNFNTGDYNDGDRNTGHHNRGEYNTGDYNWGDCNTGDYNWGDCNVGDYNTANFNIGDYNITDNSVGCFNTAPQKLKFFDEETDMTLVGWYVHPARRLLDKVYKLSGWNDYSPIHEEYIFSDEEKEILMSIPNFDAEKFYKITGIRI